MPITFEQPQPFNPGIAEMAGITAQYNRDAPLLQRHAESVAAAYARQREASDQMANAQANRAQHGAEFVFGQTAEANQRAAELQLRANVANAQMDHEARLQQARIQGQMELQTTELTHKELLDLNRLKMAQGSIEANDNLTQEEKADLRTQLFAKINPLEQRMAKTRIAQEELQNQQMQKQLGVMDRIQAERTQFMAGNLQQFTKHLTDDDGNYLGSVLMLPDGKTLQFDKTAAKAADQQRADAVQARKEQVAIDHARQRANDLVKIHNDVSKRIEQEYKNSPDPSKTDWNERERVLTEQMTAIYDKANPAPQVGAGGQLPSGSSPPAPQADPNEKPFSYADPSTQTPRQKETMGKLSDGFKAVLGSAAPKGVKDDAVSAFHEAGYLLGKYGSPQAMKAQNPADYAKFDAATSRMFKAVETAKQTPAPAPPAAAQSMRDKLAAGELVTAKGTWEAMKPALEKFDKGELVTLQKILGTPEGRSYFQQFLDGDLVTVEGLRKSQLGQAISGASPFK